MSIKFIKYYKIYFIFSGILILASLVSLFVLGLKPGIDFTGGSILEVEYKTDRPDNSQIRQQLADLNLGEIYLQPTGEKGLIIRMKDISEETHQEILQKLGGSDNLEEKRFESIGPAIGKELKEKTNIVVLLSLFAIVLYIAFAFRRVSFPAKSWQYGIASLIVLSHDILITLGVLSVLGKIYGIQITIPVITALLTVVGYAINNVVVVYDRLRENLLRTRSKQEDFPQLADNSINQTLSRQINTSLTTLIPLIFIFFIGGETLKYFALTLILGIVAGTYSSIFLACPILVAWLKRKKVI
ncbi:MAG: protein translocase subunit SecF [Candidatus Pacebacteria bacterium]|nr:protein translocase subunit SecF [Candidatus Paceibacterota bacterium]